MEWLKKKSLKQSFFIISILFLCIGLILSILSFNLCGNLSSKIGAFPKYEISLDENGEMVSSDYTNIDAAAENDGMRSTQMALLNTLQFALPVFFVVLSLVLADITFYQIKLKKPLAILKSSAERIQEQDLDFEIEKCADDEIGLLCSAFEKMRIELLNNNRELWWQMEERKRLNAAFSHDLRNPVTVLKGSAKLTKQGIKNGKATPEQLIENLTRIEDYTSRIEHYVETMSNVQRLEQVPLQKKNIDWNSLTADLESTIRLIGLDNSKQISFEADPNDKMVLLDKSILFQIVENLVSNALRFAKHAIRCSCVISENKLKLTVADDGCGFSSVLLKNGIQPFQKGSEEAEHFGMGLYICDLLCQKHGGNLEIANHKTGATVSAILKINENLRNF
ncbi:HAMP domain-containing sensor histidine kinase [Oscillospiraceae bacterium PP1C4]